MSCHRKHASHSRRHAVGTLWAILRQGETGLRPCSSSQICTGSLAPPPSMYACLRRRGRRPPGSWAHSQHYDQRVCFGFGEHGMQLCECPMARPTPGCSPPCPAGGHVVQSASCQTAPGAQRCCKRRNPRQTQDMENIGRILCYGGHRQDNQAPHRQEGGNSARADPRRHTRALGSPPVHPLRLFPCRGSLFDAPLKTGRLCSFVVGVESSKALLYVLRAHVSRPRPWWTVALWTLGTHHVLCARSTPYTQLGAWRRILHSHFGFNYRAESPRSIFTLAHIMPADCPGRSQGARTSHGLPQA